MHVKVCANNSHPYGFPHPSLCTTAYNSWGAFKKRAAFSPHFFHRMLSFVIVDAHRGAVPASLSLFFMAVVSGADTMQAWWCSVRFLLPKISPNEKRKKHTSDPVVKVNDTDHCMSVLSLRTLYKERQKSLREFGAFFTFCSVLLILFWLFLVSSVCCIMF